MSAAFHRTAGDHRTQFAREFFEGGLNASFSFDPENQLFCLDDTRVNPKDFDIWNLMIKDAIYPVDELLCSSAVVALGSGHLIQMPRMTGWLRELEGDNRATIFEEASEVMKALASNLGYKLRCRDTVGIHTSYDIIQTEAIVLSGELVVSPAATFFNQTSDWDSGFAGFEFHNVDTPQQEKILCAGLGALASICVRETQPRSIT